MNRTIARTTIEVASTLLLGFAVPAPPLTIVVDQTAWYRYINAHGSTLPTPANWFAVGFNDSSRNVGNGPFNGVQTTNPVNAEGAFFAPA